VLCVVTQSLRQADHSYRGVLPNVVHQCVWSRNPRLRTTRQALTAAPRGGGISDNVLYKTKIDDLVVLGDKS
jgi:hypothetical protein